MFNDSLRIELCENVHLHYRNVRLEFPASEFLLLREAFLRADPQKVKDWPYGKEHVCLVTGALPENTEFDDRATIEEQVDGSFHYHYRNLRIETKALADIGLPTP